MIQYLIGLAGGFLLGVAVTLYVVYVALIAADPVPPTPRRRRDEDDGSLAA